MMIPKQKRCCGRGGCTGATTNLILARDETIATLSKEIQALLTQIGVLEVQLKNAESSREYWYEAYRRMAGMLIEENNND